MFNKNGSDNRPNQLGNTLNQLKNAANTVKSAGNTIQRSAGTSSNSANQNNAVKAAGNILNQARTFAVADNAAALIKDVATKAVNKDTRKEMFKKICALIPNKVDNNAVVEVMELMRKQQKLMRKDFTAHLKTNENNFLKHAAAIKNNKGYVEDQNSYTDMAYGDATMQFSGCEIFATYNAIFNLLGKNTISLSQMISEYEKDGMVLSGKFGTAPKAIKDFLEKHNFKTIFSTVENEFDEIGRKCGSLILTMYNDKDDISQEVHTINISKENGRFTAHNAYCNGKVVGPYATVSEVIKNINNGKAKGISLIGINK